MPIHRRDRSPAGPLAEEPSATIDLLACDEVMRLPTRNPPERSPGRESGGLPEEERKWFRGLACRRCLPSSRLTVPLGPRRQISPGPLRPPGYRRLPGDDRPSTVAGNRRSAAEFEQIVLAPQRHPVRFRELG